jgi:uncharacterized Zn finger protein (UPF0148 family)
MILMRRFACKRCGSWNLRKQEDGFICHSCGARYSAEKAKKLEEEMKAQNSPPIINYYQMTKSAAPIIIRKQQGLAIK